MNPPKSPASASAPAIALPSVAAEPAVLNQRAGATLLILFLLYTLNYMDRQVMAGVAELMKRDLGLTDGQLGAMQTAFLLCVAGLALPAALILDRTSRKAGVALMAIIWSLSTALTGLAGGFAMLVTARAFVGVGEAGFSSGGTALLSAAYPEKLRAKVLGLFNAAIPLGAALGTVASSAIAERTNSWSSPFFIFAVPGLFLAVLTLVICEEQKTPASEQRPIRTVLATLFLIPSLRATYLAFAMNIFVTSAMLQWLPTYLSRTRGLDLTTAGKQAGLIMVLALVGAPLGGFLADRWSRLTPRGYPLACALTSLLAAVMLALALWLGPSTAGYVCLVAWGILAPAYLAPGGAITQDVVHPSMGATSWGMGVLAMYLLGGAYSPYLVGALSDALGRSATLTPAPGVVEGNLAGALLFVPVAGVLASLLFLVAARTYSADKAGARGSSPA